MSTVCVETASRKWRSWDTTRTVCSTFERYSSSHCTVSRSRSLVGSSRRRLSGFPKSAFASITLTFSVFESSDICFWCCDSGTPRFCSNCAASLSAVHPPSSANFSSSSATLTPSSSLKSGFMYRASFSCIFCHNGSCPIRTVFMTVYWSYLKWSCSSTERRSPGPISTVPLLGSRSPDIARSSVDLPAPLAPMTP